MVAKKEPEKICNFFTMSLSGQDINSNRNIEKILFSWFRLSICNCFLAFTLHTIIDQLINYLRNRNRKRKRQRRQGILQFKTWHTKIKLEKERKIHISQCKLFICCFTLNLIISISGIQLCGSVSDGDIIKVTSVHLLIICSRDSKLGHQFCLAT